jgi:hypothetical protein
MPPREVSSPREISSLELLSVRLGELERRISALEHSPEISGPPPRVKPGPAAPNLPRSEALPQASVLTIFGRCVLGIAGAYILRAIAESGTLHASVPVALAVAYAAAWLVWAGWSGELSALTRRCYALTAALVLSPMLWEATVRFRMLEPASTAAILVAFALLAMALAWRTGASSVAWAGMLTAVVTALVLMAATRALVPFTASLLGLAIVSEFAAARGRWPALRPVVAAAADFSLLIFIIVLGDPAAVPPEYHAVSASVIVGLAAALFAIDAVGLMVRSLLLRWKLKALDASQLAATVLLASWAVLRATHGGGLRGLGVAYLVAGAACYAVGFTLLSRHRGLPNLQFYSACGLAFVLVGSFFALHSVPLLIWLCLAAVIATGLGVHARSPALDLHGVAYLGGALWASGLLAYARSALGGTYPSFSGPLPVAAAATTLVCATMIARYPGEHGGERLLRVLPAVFAVYATAGFAVGGLGWLVAGGGSPTLPQLAVIRTGVTSVAALVLAFVGARWKRLELVWMAYAAVVLGSVKLGFEDLRFGSTESLAASLLIYGAVLILIPRLVRGGKAMGVS